MSVLLVGNGINMQFDKSSYSAQQIVLRVLRNCDRDDFPSHIIIDSPCLLKNFIGQLFLEAREIFTGKYDQYTFGSAEKAALASFKERYKGNLKSLLITDIGFEDYYLIHDLVCNKQGTQNPERFYTRESMKIAYLYAIYNDGKINQQYLEYPSGFVAFLSNFDTIFTTNYDSNIESAIGTQVYHIHGQFNKKSAVYVEDSFRNQLPDAPIKSLTVDEEFYYLYSNALSTHCGEYKEFQLKQYSQANETVDRMAHVYNTDLKLRNEIDRWTGDRNTLIANLGHAIKIKAANPNICFSDDYHFDTFQAVEGRLEILGLSPWNDFHIFESIDNTAISDCIYYYYNKKECIEIENLLPNLKKHSRLRFVSAISLWEGFDENKN